jgi:hypothetical protein
MALEGQWVEPVLLNFHCVLRKLYTETSIGAYYLILIKKIEFIIQIFDHAYQVRILDC